MPTPSPDTHPPLPAALRIITAALRDTAARAVDNDGHEDACNSTECPCYEAGREERNTPCPR